MSQASVAQPRAKGAKRIKVKTSSKLAHYIRAHRAAFLSGFSSIFSTPIGSIFTILTLGIALSLPLGGMTLWAQAVNMAESFDVGTQFQVFIEPDTPATELEYLLGQLQQTQGIDSVQYQAPEQSLQALTDKIQLGDIMLYLDTNPLPGMILVSPALDFYNSEQIHELTNALSSHDFVQEVLVDLDWIEKLNAMIWSLGRIVTVLSVVIGAGVCVILVNTIRLDLERHREETHILSLIGATRAFIQRPFMYKVMMLGLLGSLVAVGCVYLSMQIVNTPLRHLGTLYAQSFYFETIPTYAILGVFLASGLLSWLSARIAMMHTGNA